MKNFMIRVLKWVKKYNDKELFTEKLTTLFDSYISQRKEIFESQLEKIKIEEEG